jgi:hypothetical protein
MEDVQKMIEEVSPRNLFFAATFGLVSASAVFLVAAYLLSRLL